MSGQQSGESVALTEAERTQLRAVRWESARVLDAAVERIIAARLAPILTLVDAWEQAEDAVCCDYCQNSVAARRDAADAIRDALARPDMPTSDGAA